MRKKEFFITLFVLLLGFISLYIFSVLDIQLQEYAKKVMVQEYNIFRSLEVFLLIIFGILIENKRVISIFKNGIVPNKYLLVFTIVLIVLLLLPYDITARLGIPYPGSIRGTFSFIVNTANTRSILSVLAGIVLIRSLSDFKLVKKDHKIF
ncbi:MAG: hypothetical protein RBQ97_08985 [Acholeplasma sp.]|nr:hypothetical protein [Acholeplasma sp.]